MALVISRIDEGRLEYPDGTSSTQTQIIVALKSDVGLLVKRIVCTPPNRAEQTRMLKRALTEAARDESRGAKVAPTVVSALVAEASRMRSDLFEG